MTVTSNYSVNDSSILLNAVINGKGISCLTLPFIVNEIQTGTLTVLLEDFKIKQLAYGLCTPQGNIDPNYLDTFWTSA
ncbi:LysR substrate-binding domain-containing protein [Vibrio splendidus]|uniref:LysR substrate-binding domain-containing protein n=1 Tax=Vibrio TaxID=662 RepID=UPI0009C076C2|nr:hypothetical protein CWN87_17790 [Vibrio splendidus]